MRFISEKSYPKYKDYRDRFLKAAQGCGLQIKSNPILEQGPDKESLFQDFAIYDQKSPTTIVHLSGVHGIEGYLGSDIQHTLIKQALLDKSGKNKPTTGNVVFVHAVNPHGMAWHRRVNANNVDLNRNSTNHHLQSEKSESFSKFLSFLSSHSKIEVIFRWPLFLLKSLFLGPSTSSKIIASGQYKYPNSIFYGGTAPQSELILLKNTLLELFPATKKWIFIDVHTGLGPRAFDSLILTADEDHDVPFFTRCLGPRHIVDLSKNPQFYKATGLLENLMRASLPEKSVYYVTQEFGTLPFYKVLTNLILENSWFHSGKENDTARIKIALKTFYPMSSLADEHWNKRCIQAGLDRFYKIIASV